MRALTREKREGWFWIRPEARRTWPRERRRAVRIRKKIREMEKGLLVSLGGREERELERDWFGWPVVGGAKMSVRVPNAMRAMVEVMATMETWVAAEVVGGVFGG